MLKIKVNENDCVSKQVELNVKNINVDGEKLVIETNEFHHLRDDENIILKREFNTITFFNEVKKVNVIDDNTFSIETPKRLNLSIDECIDSDDIKIPFNGRTADVLKFTLTFPLNTFINKSLVIKDFYSDASKNDFSQKCCVNDFVLYDDLYLLKAKSVNNNIYTSFEEKYYNTSLNIYYDNNGVTDVLNVILPLNENKQDDRYVFYWFYDYDYDRLKKNFILKNFKDIQFYCDDNSYFIFGNNISLTKDFTGNKDSFLYKEDKHLKIDLSINELFSPSLVKNEYLRSDYIDFKKSENINNIIDMEKQIFNPRLLNTKKLSGIALTGLIENNEKSVPSYISGGIVNSINFKLKFRKRENNSWYANNAVDGWYGGEENNSNLLTELGFSENDIMYQKNCIKKSFLRLSFYDTMNRGNQSLLFYTTIFLDSNKIFNKFIKNKNDNSIRIDSELSIFNSLNYFSSSEGYYLYLYPNLCKGSLPTTIYMKAEFNHAKYGLTIPLILPNSEKYKEGYISPSDASNGGIKDLFNDLYIKVNIQYDSDKNEYIWYFNREDVNDYDNKNINLTLFEPKVNKTN